MRARYATMFCYGALMIGDMPRRYATPHTLPRCYAITLFAVAIVTTAMALMPPLYCYYIAFALRMPLPCFARRFRLLFFAIRSAMRRFDAYTRF